MARFLCLWGLRGLLACVAHGELGAQPVVSSVVAQQRPASTLVDVTYSLSLPEGASAIVALQASKDGGATFERVRAHSLLAGGAHGAGVGSGAGLQIAWDAALQGWPATPHASTVVSVKASLLGGMASAPSGTFSQGSPETEPGRLTLEAARTVTLTRSFLLQTTEVTWKQWSEVRGWALANGYSDLAAGRKGSAGTTANTDLDPVTFVNWFDAVKWLNARSEKEGLTPAYYAADGSVYRTGETLPVWNPRLDGYRLPTEAEWEYAARAGTSTAYHNGAITLLGGAPADPNLNEIGWFAGNSGNTTRPVAARTPNAWGLHDVSGNVSEWCWDWFGSYSGSAVTDPVGPATGTLRVKRGGSWGTVSQGCRSASRGNDAPATRGAGTSFRPARNADAAPSGAGETFPVITGIQVPTTLAGLWAGYDPAAEPLETEILKQWEQDGVVLRVVRFRVGVFRGQVARLAAIYGFPKGQQNLPGLVQIHGGGQFADFNAPLTNAPRGYATLSIAWAGRLNAQPDYYVDPVAVQLFWSNQTSDPAYRLTTDWGAVDGYHAPGRDPLKDFTSIRAGPMTLDVLDSPRNTGWFLATVAARRALTFLAQQPEVNPAKLGVYGHSMGGKITVLTAATDARVKAAVPSCGGISNRYDGAANPPFLGTLNDSANLAAIRAPVMLQIPTNDFHGRIDDIPVALQELGATPRALAFEAHWDHQNSAPFTAVGMLWMDQYLKGTFTLPANPAAQIVLNPTTRAASLSVTLDASQTIQAVDIYYSQQGLPTTGTVAERQRLSQGRFWRHVHATQSAGAWSAPLPVWDTTRPVIAFANVTYALLQPLTAVGPYYGKYTATSYVLSTPLEVVDAAALAQANIAQETLTPGLIEDFAADWDKEWFTYSPSNWARTSRKIGDPRWAAPAGASALRLDVRADRANKLVITLDGHAAVVSLVGGMWEQISLTPADFKNATGAALASWNGLKQLRLGDTDRLVSGSTVLNVGATWQGTAPQFRNLRWVTAD
ncbi:MAG: SUMF1/EgtB/PvdO family nonheme iron enzyme [Opitutaceae bacterium]|nr:SUMF1/EgtB/PvdO family nonheme iron enzyme [Opitutaceae bacterium]